MRLFVAVNLAPSVIESIQTAIDAFPVQNPPWRWTRTDAWHVTLKFIGETPWAISAGSPA